MAAPLSRAAVVAAAREMIATKGLDAVSLRGLSATLGVTAPALYAYVTDKHDLLRAVAEHEFSRLLEVFDAIDDPDPLVRVASYSRAYIDYAVANPSLFRTMFLFPPEMVLPELGEADLPIASTAFEVPYAAIGEAIDTGALPAGTDPLLAALTLWTATHGAADVLLLGLVFDPDAATALVDAVLDTVITGLRHGGGAPVAAGGRRTDETVPVQRPRASAHPPPEEPA